MTIITIRKLLFPKRLHAIIYLIEKGEREGEKERRRQRRDMGNEEKKQEIKIRNKLFSIHFQESFDLRVYSYMKSFRLVVGSELYTGLVMKGSIFPDIEPCSWFKVKGCFGGNFHLHLQGRRIIQAGNHYEGGNKESSTALCHTRWWSS
jgi:hypothetical protein